MFEAPNISSSPNILLTQSDKQGQLAPRTSRLREHEGLESRGQTETISVILSTNVENVQTAVGSKRLGNAGVTKLRVLKSFFHNKFLHENCEYLAVISFTVIHEEVNSFLYPYTFKTNDKVLESLGDVFTTDKYAWHSQEKFLNLSDLPNLSRTFYPSHNHGLSRCAPPHLPLQLPCILPRPSRTSWWSPLFRFNPVRDHQQPPSPEQCYPSQQHFNIC